ncbi:MAG: iron-containing alcohol dehydrogenase [Treponema sp.]|jgi:alcohol dehydrogenase YqhD (iron-dependent ADH family)|nr:iron-containing alcohol dehydrogenase [Treponema sp.]
MNNFVFQNPTKIIFGKGTVSQLFSEINARGVKRLLLTTGSGSVKTSGLYEKVCSQLTGIEVLELSGITPNPKMESIDIGVNICKKNKVDMILAVGGGSVIDGSKAIAAGAVIDENIWDIAERRIEEIVKAVPLACILTLPATGTEMNGNSVISKWDTREKLSLYGPAIYPVFSILDPELTFSIPKTHTTYGNIDIIIHALEQYFTHTPATPLLDRLTEGLVITMVENSIKVLDVPADYDTRANLMFCGTVANNHWIGVGKEHDWASHNIEHELSALYDVPHGAGLAVIYPNWMKYVMQKDPGKFAQFAERVWSVSRSGRKDIDVAQEGVVKMREFFKRIGAPVTLQDLEIDVNDIPHMAKQATRFGPIGGYCKLNTTDVERILEMCNIS